MKKDRTKWRSGTIEEVQKRNKAMFKRYKKLDESGKYTKMKIYEMLAKEFDFDFVNSVYPIVLKMEKEQKEMV